MQEIRDEPAMAEMPRYTCHKKVWALKIQNILPSPTHEGAILSFDERGFAPRHVNQAYMQKHDPKVGGYFVIYDDGYESFSPARAFEEGYTRDPR